MRSEELSPAAENREQEIENSVSLSARLDATADCPRGLKPTAADIEPLRGSGGSASRCLLPTVYCLLLAVFIVSRLVLNVYTPLMEPSEARYAVLTKNLTLSESWWSPKYNFEGVETEFFGKPPLTFQLSKACCKALGFSTFAARLPVFLSAVLILCLIWRNVNKWRDAQCAACAVLLTCCSFLFYMYSGQIITDLILTVAVVGAIFSYVGFEQSCEGLKGGNEATNRSGVTQFAEGEPTKLNSSSGSPDGECVIPFAALTPLPPSIYSVLFFVWIALGILVKGPVAIVMSGLPVFFYVLINNRWRNLKYHAWLSGTAAFLLICIPWYVVLEIKHPGFFKYFIVNENFYRYLFHDYGDKFGAGRESFRGVSFLWFLALNLPTVFLMQLLPSKNRKRMYCWNMFKDPLVGMSALTCISLTLFWALTSRVLITYLLPTIPFFAVFLAVRFRDSGLLEQSGFSKKLNIILTSWLILLPVLFAGAVYASVYQTSEMASPIIADAVKVIENDSAFSERNYYFACVSPHIAEYYYKDKTRFHVPESLEDSLKNSKDDWLFITESQKNRLGKPIDRKLVFQKGQWSLYAPFETDVLPERSVHEESPLTDLTD